MQNHKRLRRLLEGVPGFSWIRNRLQPGKSGDLSASPVRIHQKPVMRRLTGACVFLVFLAVSAGICSFLSTSCKISANSAETSMLTSSLSTSLSKNSVQKEVSSTASALLYNILPAQGIDDYWTLFYDLEAEHSAGFSSEEISNCYLYRGQDDNALLLGPALQRELEECSPDSVHNVVVNVEYADPSSNLVSEIQSQSLLSLDSSRYYVQLDQEEIYQYARADMEIMLVAPGAPKRPYGYPEILDDGCAWIYQQSPDGTPLSVQLSIPVPDTAGSSGSQYDRAMDYVSQILSSFDIEVYDSNLTIQQKDERLYALYLTSLDRQSAFLLCDTGLIEEIEAIVNPISSNSAEQEYFYLAYGDGWVFSN